MKRNTKILIICLAAVLLAAIVVIALLLNKSYTDEYTAELDIITDEEDRKYRMHISF